MKPFPDAPDFELTDLTGKPVRLTNYKGHKNILLVFLRGFL